MNKSDALRIFIAAQDDPVLASWAAVAHEYKLTPLCDVSPYEYWEAFQEFFSHGLVTPAQYDGIDARQVFFSGRRPPAQDVQRVLDNLHKLPERQFQEPSMTKTKLPENPFASNGTSLVPKEGNGLANGHRNGHALPARQASPGLNPFSTQHEALPREKSHIPMEAFGSGTALPCRDSGRPDKQALREMGEVQLQVWCCGEELEMEVADMQADGPDSIPGGQLTVIDRVLHGTCKRCNREHHHSVGEVSHHGSY